MHSRGSAGSPGRCRRAAGRLMPRHDPSTRELFRSRGRTARLKRNHRRIGRPAWGRRAPLRGFSRSHGGWIGNNSRLSRRPQRFSDATCRPVPARTPGAPPHRLGAHQPADVAPPGDQPQHRRDVSEQAAGEAGRPHTGPPRQGGGPAGTVAAGECGWAKPSRRGGPTDRALSAPPRLQRQHQPTAA